MNVAIIELGKSHEECIYTQILFLKSKGHNVFLVHNSRLKHRMQSLAPKENTLSLKISDIKFLNFFAFKKIRNFLHTNHIKKAVINTVEDKTNLQLVKNWHLTDIELVGLLHNVHKLSLLKNLPVRKYYVLGEYLLNHLKDQLDPGYKGSYFYPSYFPSQNTVHIPKRKNDFWVCIPGQVEQKRRDYKHLFNLLAASKLEPNVKFILLGRSYHEFGVGRDIKAQIARLNLESNFQVFEDYVDMTLFHSYMVQSDIVLPLIHEGNPDYKRYKSTKISGAFNLAYAYRIPLLMDSTFNEIEDFLGVAIFYKKNDLIEVINELSADRTLLNTVSYDHQKWSFEHQCEQYLKLLAS